MALSTMIAANCRRKFRSGKSNLANAFIQTQFNIGAFSGLEGGDVLDNFDFDSFLHDDGGFEFDASNFNMGGGDGVEAGAEGA